MKDEDKFFVSFISHPTKKTTGKKKKNKRRQIPGKKLFSFFGSLAVWVSF